MSEAPWEDVDEWCDPEGSLAASKFTLEVGAKMSLDGVIPCVHVTVEGHPHLEDGAIDLGRKQQQRFVMRKADARAFALSLLEATEKTPR